MTKQEFYSAIEEIVENEYQERSYEVKGDPDWDIPKTVAAVTQHLLDDEWLAEFLANPNREEWEKFETVHWSVVDYLSTYEPVYVEGENA